MNLQNLLFGVISRLDVLHKLQFVPTFSIFYARHHAMYSLEFVIDD
jgi:hypothetical protein